MSGVHWLKVTVETAQNHAEATEAALIALGAGAVTLTDAGDDPVLEPAPGATPLWRRVRISGLFDASLDCVRLVESLRAALPAATAIDAEPVPDEDWLRSGMRDYRPLRFGSRLWICPTGTRAPAADAIVVELDPGMAFGSGTHPTTALCLEWLDGADLRGTHVIDYGCGSGVLAIAALRLGAARAEALDIDPQALIASADNARRNNVAGQLSIATPDRVSGTPADVLVANILARPLIELAPRFATLVRPGGRLVLSGLLDSQGSEVRAACAPWFEWDSDATRDGWLRLDGCRT